MKILLVSQYFWPEFFVINDLVKTLSSEGHSIKVLTGKPNYPSGELFEGYEKQGCVHEAFGDNVPVFRAPLRPRKSGGGKNLLLNYFSFVWNGLRFFPAAVKGENFDVILVFAPSPISSAIPALYLKWKLNCHLAIWVQDLWPESLSATGYVKNSVALKAVGRLVKYIYSKADTLLVQSQGFIAPVSRLAKKEKIFYYPNSYKKDESLGKCTRKKEWVEEVPSGLIDVLENNLCITFAGNLGAAQSLETIVGAAGILKDIPNLKIVIIGTGSLHNFLLKEKEAKQLSNVVLPGRLPSYVMPNIFQRSEALLVTLKDKEIFSYTIPSKVQAYMASARPIIASLNGEGKRVIDESGAGITCEAENEEDLACCIRHFVKLSEKEKKLMSEAAYAYYVDHFEMSTKAKDLINILSRRVLEG